MFEVESDVEDCIDKDVAASYLQQTYCEIGIPCHTWAKLYETLRNSIHIFADTPCHIKK